MTVESMLPGERHASASAQDVGQWLTVYRRLVARCRQRGITHRRFEARLAYWERMAVGDGSIVELTAPVGEGRAADEPMRCPFAPFGLDSDVMAACPGFEGDDVRLTEVLPGTSGGGTSCRHVLVQPSDRGFTAACGHPDGLPEHADEDAARAFGWDGEAAVAASPTAR